MRQPLKASRTLLLAGLAVLFLIVWGVLYADNQRQVALVLGAAVILIVAARVLRVSTVVTYAADAFPQTAGIACLVGILALTAVLYDNSFALLLLCTLLLFSMVGFGLNIQFGYAGILNFAGAAFFGVGSYTAAVLATRTNMTGLLILLSGGILSAVIGSLLILPVLRTRGHYSALVTLAFGILFETFLEVNDALGGPQGVQIPGMKLFGWAMNQNIQIGGIEISYVANYAVLSMVLCAASFILVRRLERSWIGVAMDMVRTDEISAATFGIPIARIKITAFTIANFLIGVAGATYGMLTSYTAPGNFTFVDSLILVSVLLLGGMGNPVGVLPATAIILILPQKLQFIQEYRLLIFGLMVIAILLFRPDGLIPRSTRKLFAGRGAA